MATKNVKKLNYASKLPQVQSLEGEAFQEEQLKLQQIMAKKAGTYYNGNTATVRVNETEVYKESWMKNTDSEQLKDWYFIRKDYVIWVNGVPTRVRGTSRKAGFTEDTGVKVSVNFTGEQLAQRIIEQQTKF